MTKFGITERGDIHFHEEWIQKMRNGIAEAAVLISKGMPTPNGQKEMLANPGKYIFHATITGMGGTYHEPNTRPWKEALAELVAFCDKGFPKDRVVVRVDPIIPDKVGFETAKAVIRHSWKAGFRNFRYSYMDIYSHVERAYQKIGKPVPVGIRQADPKDIDDFDSFLCDAEKYDCNFASCAENNRHQRACIGDWEFEKCGLGKAPAPNFRQRSSCLCSSAKTELLEHLGQCPHRCTYCYWKH